MNGPINRSPKRSMSHFMSQAIKSPKYQRGLTIWGWILTIAMIAFFANVVLSAYPMVFNHFKVKSHLANFAKQPGADTMTKAEVIDTLRKRFEVDNVEFIDLAKQLKIEEKPKEKKRIIRIEYEVRQNFFGNFYILGDYTDTLVEVATD